MTGHAAPGTMIAPALEKMPWGALMHLSRSSSTLATRQEF
jgi:hypothetical protein